MECKSALGMPVDEARGIAGAHTGTTTLSHRAPYNSIGLSAYLLQEVQICTSSFVSTLLYGNHGTSPLKTARLRSVFYYYY